MKFGMDAIIAVDFPHEFIALTMLKSYELDISLAIRSGQPPNTFKGFEVSPKPITMKTKTCSFDQHIHFLAGFIPWDQQIFGRENNPPIPKNDFKPVQLYVRLHEILADAKNGEYTDLTVKNNYLEFRTPCTDTDVKKNMVFSLDLTKRKPALKLDNVSSSNLTPCHAKSEIKKPSFWPDDLLDFESALADLFPISYRLCETNPVPLYVAATLDNKPITSDADILWIGIPNEIATATDHKQYNVTNTDELRALLLHYLSLCSRLAVSKTSSLLKHIASFAKTAGVITPFELLTEKVINDECAKNFPHFYNLFQHGPETNNPGKPSSLDSKILHFFRGIPVLTENEDELIKLVLQDGFLEKYYIRIHPGWNMEKWSPVIKRQIELNQTINPATLDSYNQYQECKQMDKKDLSPWLIATQYTFAIANKKVSFRENFA